METIEQTEAGTASPDLGTLRQIAAGLDLMLSALFESFDRQDEPAVRKLVALVRGRDPAVVALVTRVVRTMLEGADKIRALAKDRGKGD